MARGKVTFNITGGTPPYRVLFRNEANSEEAYGGYFTDSGSNKEIEIAEDVSSGLYVLEIIDNNGCIVTETGLTVGVAYTVVFYYVNETFSINLGDVSYDSTPDPGGRDRNSVILTLPPGSYSYTATRTSDDFVINGTVNVVDDSVSINLAGR